MEREHRLTHILTDSAQMKYVSFRFNNFTSPEVGSYKEEPNKQVEIPVDMKVSTIEFKNHKEDDHITLYSIKVTSDDEKSIQICPKEEIKHSSDTIKLYLGEYIVSAQVDISGYGRLYPGKISFLVYDSI
jgi:hypothetical protein